MKPHLVLIFTLFCGFSKAADPEPLFPKLPATPKALIEKLKETKNDRYTVSGTKIDFVRESDLPYLVKLLDSKEPCAFLDLAKSSISYPGKSTVGREAAYLVEGFWKRYYPTELTSQKFDPDTEAIKRWYRLYQHRKKIEAPESETTKLTGKEELEKAVQFATYQLNAYLILANRLNPEKEYRLLSAQNLVQKGEAVWWITFKAGSLLPSKENPIIGVGGEIFVSVDLKSQECKITFGE